MKTLYFTKIDYIRSRTQLYLISVILAVVIMILKFMTDGTDVMVFCMAFLLQSCSQPYHLETAAGRTRAFCSCCLRPSGIGCWGDFCLVSPCL